MIHRSTPLMFGLLVLLCGCNTLRGASAPPPPPPPPGFESGRILGATAGAIIGYRLEAVAGRDYLMPRQTYLPAANALPNGLILLRVGDSARNRAVCQAFVRGLEAESDIRARDPGARIISTYWLLNARVTNRTDCAQLLAAYDFARAEGIRARYRLAARPGPVLLGLGADGEHVAADLSRAEPARMAQIMRIWFRTAAGASAALAGGMSGAGAAQRSAAAAAPPPIRRWACDVSQDMHGVIGVSVTGSVRDIMCRRGAA